MLGIEIVQRAHKLLTAGRSQRAIARELHISRGSVLRIAKGQCRGRESGDQSVLRTRRCACGSLYYDDGQARCRACRLKHLLKRTGMRIRAGGDAGPLELDLLPEDRQRYEGVRARKLAEIRRRPPASEEELELDDGPPAEFDPLQAHIVDLDVLEAFEK